MNDCVKFPYQLVKVDFVQNYTEVRSSPIKLSKIDYSCLTSAEHVLMQWLVRGKTADEVAIILGKSSHTVRNQIKSIRRKFGGASLRVCIAVYGGND